MTDLLASIRTYPRYRSIHERREKHATEARQAQARYRRLTRGFIVASSTAAVIGGLVLYGIEASSSANNPEQLSAGLHGFVSHPNVQLVLLLLQAIAVGTAGFCAYVLNAQDYGRTWRETRAKAEELRQQRALVLRSINTFTK